MSWLKPVVSGTTPTPRMGHQAVLLGEKIYVYGGMNGEHSYMSEVWIFSPGSKTIASDENESTEHLEKISDASLWHQPQYIGEVPTPRIAHTVTLVGKKLFVFGGDSGKNLLSDIFVGETDIELQQIRWEMQEEVQKVAEKNGQIAKLQAEVQKLRKSLKENEPKE